LSNERNNSWGEGANEGIKYELILSNLESICWIRAGGGILSDGGSETLF